MNPIYGPVTTQPGMHIGQFTPVSDDDTVADSVPECNASASPAQPSLPNAKQHEQPSKLPINVKCGHVSSTEMSQLTDLLLCYYDRKKVACDVFVLTTEA